MNAIAAPIKPFRPASPARPTLVRRPADSGLFRGWGPTL
jgi:hypothetical protein